MFPNMHVPGVLLAALLLASSVTTSTALAIPSSTLELVDGHDTLLVDHAKRGILPPGSIAGLPWFAGRMAPPVVQARPMSTPLSLSATLQRLAHKHIPGDHNRDGKVDSKDKPGVFRKLLKHTLPKIDTALSLAKAVHGKRGDSGSGRNLSPIPPLPPTELTHGLLPIPPSSLRRSPSNPRISRSWTTSVKRRTTTTTSSPTTMQPPMPTISTRSSR